MSQKKINPRRRPATMADVDRAKREAIGRVTSFMMAIVMTVLYDKEGFAPEDLRRVIAEMNDLSDSVSKCYVSVNDLLKTLHEETGINVMEEI